MTGALRVALTALLVLTACSDPMSGAVESLPRGTDPPSTSQPAVSPGATPLPPLLAVTDSPDTRPTRSPDAFSERAGSCDDQACAGAPVSTGVFDAERIPEASGLAASIRNPGVLWILDDGRTAGVWAVRTGGEILGLVEVAGMDSMDTEGLAVSACAVGKASSCVYVGDIGDNMRSRESVSVYRFAEPDLAGGVPVEPVSAARAELRYPDGPANAETLLVADGVPYVVTKAVFDRDTRETGVTRLFGAGRFADGELEDLGALDVAEPRLAFFAPLVGNVVTGGDHAEGRPGAPRVVLRTYDHVLEYRARRDDAPLSALPTWESRELAGPILPQAEAVAYAADGCGWYTVSEGIGEIWKMPCEP